MVSHATRLILIALAALAVLIAYVFLTQSGGDAGFLEGMMIVLFPALVDAGAEAQRRSREAEVPANERETLPPPEG